MPDIWKVEYALFGEMKLYGANVKFNGGNKCNRGKQSKIGNDKYLARSAVF